MGINNFKKRIVKLQQELFAKDVDAYLISDPIDLYYFLGKKLSTGHLFIDKNQACLFVDGRYFEACQDSCPCPVFLNTSQSGGSTFLKFIEESKWKSLGFDAEKTSYLSYMQLKEQFENKMTLKPISQMMKLQRVIKDKEEIGLLNEAAKLGAEGFDFVCSILKKGIKEIEVARELEIFWLKKGAQKTAFEPIIAFGANSSQPHYRPSECSLKPDQAVLIDIGVTLNHYHSDMTRTVFFGRPDEKFLEIYYIVKEAQSLALSHCKAGESTFFIDQLARNHIEEKGYGKFFTHGLGHGVGLELHELPVLRNDPAKKVILEEGMIVTIEPGIYLPCYGGVRIEDTIVITKNGYELLTTTPKDLCIIDR